MPLKRFKAIATAACVVAAQSIPAIASLDHPIKNAGDLTLLSAELQGTPDKGFHRILFSTYANAGKLTLSGPSANIDSLILLRSDSNSDEAVKIDSSTFLDLKTMPGKVILRGLAFQLSGPRAVLISGSAQDTYNKSLLIEDCIIYGDSLDNTFISWLADANANVEIRRSFFVSKNGKSTAHINVAAGKVSLTNDLFNFPGSILGTASTSMEINYNTVNRTQFQLASGITSSPPALQIIRNLIAYPPTVDAISGTGMWALRQTGFDAANADVKNNRLGDAWAGFDYQFGSNNTLWSADPVRNTTVSLASLGKAQTEAWNWYTTAYDTSLGLQAGSGKRLNPYNVFPGDSLNYSWNLPKGALTAFFQPATFPREIKLDTSSIFPAFTLPSIRPLFLRTRSLAFGAFRVDSIKYGVESIYGQPQLIVAKDLQSPPLAQPVSGSTNAKPSIFVNTLLTARQYFLGNLGNTARGTNITPAGSDAQISSDEKLVFSKVDSAGSTSTFERLPTILPDNLRSLGTSFSITTTASTSDSITFGSKKVVTAALWPKSMYWFLPDSKSLFPVVVDSGRYLATVPYALGPGIEFDAHLVEKLSVIKGDTTVDVKGGKLRTVSAAGFQMLVNDTARVDTSKFGRVSNGFRFSWSGRGASDLVSLTLNGSKDQDAYVATAQATPKLDSVLLDSTGHFRISIGPADTLKTFFLAMKFNIIANTPASKVTEGISDATIEGFTSSTSGRLALQKLPGNFLDSVAQKDTALASTRFLGGRSLSNLDLHPSGTFTVSFALNNAFQTKDSVEAWVYSAKKWSKLVDSLDANNAFVGKDFPASAEIVLIVERLAAPETYVTVLPAFDSKTNQVNIFPAMKNNLNPVTGYCVELRSFDAAGNIDSVPCVQKPIGTDTSFLVKPASQYLYRIRYYMQNDSITRPFEPLKGPALSLSAIPSDLANKPKQAWSLIGFPFSAHFKAVIKKSVDALGKNVIDADSLEMLSGMGKGSGFHAVPDINLVNVRPGAAFLYASSHDYSIRTDSAKDSLTAKPYTISVDSGWNLISNPYPSVILNARIHAQNQKKLYLFRLMPDSSAAEYRWDQAVTAVRAYEGYLYFSMHADSLVFDPFADLNAQAAVKAAAGAVTSLRAELKSAWGRSAMRLTSDPEELNIPFMSVPAAAAELRIGGGAGYMIKKEANLNAIDEVVEMRVVAPGRAAFSLAAPGDVGPASAAPRELRLFDLTSGKVYDQVSAADLPLRAGSQAFRLVSGDKAFIEARTQSIQAGAPREISLSQNFPNPFRGKTNVAMDWPAWDDGERRAVLDVIDMRGRSISRIRMDDIHVGHQVVTLDASAWKPGIYLYRLTVVTGDKQARLQKRMLVAP